MNYLILDIATAALDEAATYLDEGGDIAAPANYKDPMKIAEYIANERARRTERAALDPDLGRITAIGQAMDGYAHTILLKTEDDERERLQGIAAHLHNAQPRLIGYNSLTFDWPYLMRRALYLGVEGLTINCDRYRSPHVDLLELLTHHGKLTSRPLGFYAKRFGWTDVTKPLSGAEEAQVPKTGRWDDLRASIEHDLTITARLAHKLGVLSTESEPIL
jgi:DNA polymerase elongation subunit (family B)